MGIVRDISLEENRIQTRTQISSILLVQFSLHRMRSCSGMYRYHSESVLFSLLDCKFLQALKTFNSGTGKKKKNSLLVSFLQWVV